MPLCVLSCLPTHPHFTTYIYLEQRVVFVVLRGLRRPDDAAFREVLGMDESKASHQQY